jgi:hypothetical protein
MREYLTRVVAIPSPTYNPSLGKDTAWKLIQKFFFNFFLIRYRLVIAGAKLASDICAKFFGELTIPGIGFIGVYLIDRRPS